MLDFIQQISSVGLKYLSFFCGALSAFVLIFSIFPDTDQLAARKRLGMEDESIQPKNVGIFKMLYRFYSALASLFYSEYFPAWAVAWVEKKRPTVAKKLTIANLRSEITPDEFIAFGLTMALLVPALVYYMFGVAGVNVPAFLHPAILLFGFFYSDIWLAAAVKTRQKKILRALPYTLDLLTLSVEAGMDFIASIQRMSERSKKNALIEELDVLLKEIRLGTARSDALRNLSERLEIEEISSFTSLLIQADQLGSSIGKVLRAQADQLRTKRFQNAETEGAKASQMILLPLVFCIFPAVFIVILGPLVVKFLVQGGLF